MTQERVVEMAGINPEYLGEIQRWKNNPTELFIYKFFQCIKSISYRYLSMEMGPLTGKKHT